jgi:hypothetical protein
MKYFDVNAMMGQDVLIKTSRGSVTGTFIDVRIAKKDGFEGVHCVILASPLQQEELAIPLTWIDDITVCEPL